MTIGIIDWVYGISNTNFFREWKQFVFEETGLNDLIWASNFTKLETLVSPKKRLKGLLIHVPYDSRNLVYEEVIHRASDVRVAFLSLGSLRTNGLSPPIFSLDGSKERIVEYFK